MSAVYWHDDPTHAPLLDDDDGSWDHPSDGEGDPCHATLPTAGREVDFAAQVLPTIVWKRLRVHDALLYISNEGRIREAHDSLSTEGLCLPGTPFRTYAVEDHEYYVHDLVWRAFHGDPPPGWEVRHRANAVHGRSKYPNALAALDIFPARVVLRPTLTPGLTHPDF